MGWDFWRSPTQVTLPLGGSSRRLGEGCCVTSCKGKSCLICKTLPVQFASEFSDPPRGRVTAKTGSHPPTKKPPTKKARQVCRQAYVSYSQIQKLIAFKRKQRHESRSLDRLSNCVLRDCGTTCFPPTDNSTVTIDKLLQQLNIFVVDVHRTWPFAIDVQWIFPLRASFGFRFTTVRFSSHLCQLIGRLNIIQQNWTDRREHLPTKSVRSPAIMQISADFARH